MFKFLKRLFATPPPNRRATAVPLPPELERKFFDWYDQQGKASVTFAPDPKLDFDAKASRLFGPALLRPNEEWPIGQNGKWLYLLAQINCEDCTTLEGYPQDGWLQFFIGADETCAHHPTDPTKSDFLVRWIAPDISLEIRSPPYQLPDGKFAGEWCSFLPSWTGEPHSKSVGLSARPTQSFPSSALEEVGKKLFELGIVYGKYEDNELYEAIDDRSLRAHHCGGYPAFAQDDIRWKPSLDGYDIVLLRLTSDDHLMWGDCGECVFLMRSKYLLDKDFSKVAYSWDG